MSFQSITDPVPGYDLQLNWDCGGTVLGQQAVPDVQSCATLCDDNAECLAFVLDVRNATMICWIKKSCDTFTEMVNVHTYRQGQKIFYCKKNKKTLNTENNTML